jgi:hypothetical protein
MFSMMFQQQQPTDWVSLANQAMDKIGKAVQGVVDTVTKAAPLVWHMAVRQAWIDGVELLAIGGMLSAVCFIISNEFKKYGALEKTPARSPSYGPMDKVDCNMGRIIFLCIGIIILIPFVANAMDYILNPQWQAIRILINAAKTGGQ